MVGAVGACVRFAEGSALLQEIGGISVSTRQVERDAERRGEDAARFEREVVDAPAGPRVPTMYLGQDGTGVPMRKEELEGRALRRDRPLLGANAIASLRCCRVSRRYEDFWEWRAEQKRAA
ncbi:MAG: hypothetical protein EXR69_05320 [Myxococcales bacterium]|nr:hypothetical protein [Myxococcales bacterium]